MIKDEMKMTFTQKITREEMKNRISMALKDPILQQGFEIICKENLDLKARLNVIGLLTPELKKKVEIKNATITKAKELLNEFMRLSKASEEDFEHDYSELIGDTEQFIKDLEK